jgi:hypothetical protein
MCKILHGGLVSDNKPCWLDETGSQGRFKSEAATRTNSGFNRNLILKVPLA